MPRSDVPLSEYLSRAIDEATRFLENVWEHTHSYVRDIDIEELPQITQDCLDAMIGMKSVLLNSRAKERLERTVIDVPLTLELRMAIAQAADAHRVLLSLTDSCGQFTDLLRRILVAGEDVEDQWEPFAAQIVEARCEVLKFLSFAFLQNQ